MGKKKGGEEAEELLTRAVREKKRGPEFDLAKEVRSRVAAAEKEVDVSNLGVTDAALLLLLQDVQVKCDVDTLILSENEITDIGGADLALFLQNDTCITSLDLYGNRLGDAGICAISEALLCNATATLVDLRANRYTKRGHDAILNAQEENTSVAICHDYTPTPGEGDCCCLVM
eukprot:TRINITY_DN544_c2_g1_i1.p1 TRINITY_DN544_c2_g1~~TRINITY_DN544_c2_g1_i1.p1  ORF type:complete len:188 (+),score=60.56 TRINITY_DN544_c2_g1_i1:44-565(+)